LKTKIQKLERILEIANQQRELLACADLEKVKRLQAERQQLLEESQILGAWEADEVGVCGRILKMDQEIRCLLSSKLVDLEERVQKIARLKKLLRTRQPLLEDHPRRFSRRV